MDRSFLTDQNVVAASRHFVCVRAATYEIEAEVPFLNSLFRGRSPELENTVFSLLAPDGETQISQGGRSPQMAFRTDDNTQIIKELKAASESYKPKSSEPPSALPFAKNLRMALNVAACDNLPLVICLTGDPSSLSEMERSLAPLAWGARHIGLFHYVHSSIEEASGSIDGTPLRNGLVIVQPDKFGTKGTVLAEHHSGDTTKTLSETLDEALAGFDRQPAGETRSHVRDGKRSGVHWETATPITDQGRKRREDPPGRP